MIVPLLDLKANYLSLKTEIDAAIAKVINRTAFILGDEVTEFEKAWGSFLDEMDPPYVIGVGSGTSALALILQAMELEGTEVLTTPLTFVATASAIAQAGAKPKFLDVDKYGNLDPERVEDAIKRKRPGAILVVHLHGLPADMPTFRDLSRKYNVPLVEDAAQAHGASFHGSKCGAFMHDVLASGFSFYPGKNLGAFGDAGAVVTRDREFATKIRQLRHHGCPFTGGAIHPSLHGSLPVHEPVRYAKYDHEMVGYTDRMDTIQAAVLLAKLKKLKEWNERRDKLARRYVELFETLDKKREISLPRVHWPDRQSSWHIFAVKVEPEIRDAVLTEMNHVGIGAGVHYPKPLHMQKAFAHLGYNAGDFPNAEAAAASMISLPLYPEMTEEQQNLVVRVLLDAVEREYGE